MDSWYQLSFTEERLSGFSDTLNRIHNAQRFANWPAELRVSVTKRFVLIEGIRAVVIYFPPPAAARFKKLIDEMGGKPCCEPAPDGLLNHGI